MNCGALHVKTDWNSDDFAQARAALAWAKIPKIHPCYCARSRL